MKILLKSVKIFDSASKYHLKIKDVLIENGIITKIDKEILAKADLTLDEKDTCVSSAWFDVGMHIYEPGFEYREDFCSGLAAAAKGGFGTVAIMPNTMPALDNKTQVEFVKSMAKDALVQVYPLGSVSNGIEGKDLAEMYDMYHSGALAFTDGSKPIQDAGLMERALLYVKKTDAMILSNPYNEDLGKGSQMHEGIVSTQLGLTAAPALAEELMIVRDLYLQKHTNSPLHFLQVSTKKGVELIRKAKAEGQQITAGVALLNLIFTDDVLLDFDTNFKVKPHLKSKQDIDALIEGLKDGTIDVIISGHKPLHQDEKKVEFENALFGASTIENAFQALNTYLADKLDAALLVEKLTAAYSLFSMKKPEIKEGEKANLSLFSFGGEEVLSADNLVSKGKNNPFIGQKVKGSIKGIINGTKTNLK